MKLKFLIFLASVFVLMPVYGQENDVDPIIDLQKRIRDEVNNYINQIETLQGEELIEAADLISGTGVTDPALYQSVREKVEILFQDHLANRRDSERDDVLNALIRTMASLGTTDTVSILHNIRDETKSRGIRNRAHRLLPRLDWYTSRNQLMQLPDFYKPNQKLMTHRYLNLINSDDPRMRRYGAEELNRRRDADPVVFEAMARILDKEKHQIKSDVHLDSLAWYCRVLRDHGGEGYQSFLQGIVDDSDVHKKLKKYAD